ncbi:MAG: thiamine-binding protein [Chloroflexi bacterium]|nr:thiamine-binding protein [Chloroflexota bacterium]MCY3937960.1 thiamine-binding protein [Chloroflexota bacterium]
MPKASLAIQVMPLQSDEPLEAVNAAIAAIKESGVVHEVGPMETALEGDDLDRLVEVAVAAHRAALATSGAVQSNIRLLESQTGVMTMGEKTAPFRSA